MTDYNYINDLIGIPFKENGRDEDGLDCYGLVLKVTKDQLGADLPDWASSHTARDVVETIEATLGKEVLEQRAVEVRAPDDWDIVVVKRKTLPYHMGICLAGGVLHASRDVGVTFKNLGLFMIDNGAENVRFYKWQRL